MTELWKYHRESVLVFQAIEGLDYILYAIEGYEKCGDEVILVHVLRNVSPRLDKVASMLPELREHIWTDELRDFCANKVLELAHIPEERKSPVTV